MWIIWDKVFKSELSKFCEKQPLKYHIPLDFLKAAFHEIYLLHS